MMAIYALSIAYSLPRSPKAIQVKFKLGWKQCVHLTLRIAALAARLFAFSVKIVSLQPEMGNPLTKRSYKPGSKTKQGLGLVCFR